MRSTTPWPLSYGDVDGWTRLGSVSGVSQRTIRVAMPGLSIGACVAIERGERPAVIAEVVDLDGDRASCVPLGDAAGIITGATARSSGARVGSYVGDMLLGCDTDAWGRCDWARFADVSCGDRLADSLERAPIRRALHTGVAAIDAFATLGYGQRIALFAGAGVGKTTLLRHVVERADVDARVIALVGERGREAAETIARLRGDRSRSTTTVVCATADAPPLERLAAARTATAHAQALARQGRDVLLVVDSLTRVATAWREHALAAGEAPAHRGHPPSLAGALAAFVERAGSWTTGTVTGVYAVLVDGDDVREPVTDAIRGLLDGHIVLSRKLAEAGSFPAIDVLRSLSRLMSAVASQSHQADAAAVRAALASLEQAEDLFAIGAYHPGGDPALDAAVAVRPKVDTFLFGPRASGQDTFARTLSDLADIGRGLRAKPSPEHGVEKPRKRRRLA